MTEQVRSANEDMALLRNITDLGDFNKFATPALVYWILLATFAVNDLERVQQEYELLQEFFGNVQVKRDNLAAKLKEAVARESELKASMELQIKHHIEKRYEAESKLDHLALELRAAEAREGRCGGCCKT